MSWKDRLNTFFNANENAIDDPEFDGIDGQDILEEEDDDPRLGSHYPSLEQNSPESFTTGGIKMGNNIANNVIPMMGNTNGNAEVVIVEPHSFDEMPQVIQTLRNRKSVVLNLNGMAPEEAQRAVDFVAGGTYAIDGHQERVGESIFLFTPSCIKVSTFSGTVHDVPDVPNPTSRTSAPASDWANRLVQ